MTSLANIHVIHGKPGLSAMVMRALIQAQGHEWVDVEVTNTRVIVKGRRKGQAEWTTAGFSTADAQTAKLQLGGYPQDKLYARASARLARRAFADVIAGMPYAAEEIEDGIADEDSPAAIAAEGTASAPPPAADKPRTAQRASRRPTAAGPADASAQAPRKPPAPAPASGPTAPSGDALPPLPGEEEPDPTGSPRASSPAGQVRSPEGTSPPSTSSPDGSASSPDDSDYDTHGTVTTPQITAIWTVLNKEFQFGSDEKDQARGLCGQIIGRELASTKDLSRNEAKGILDTLGHWKAQAAAKQEDTRAYLIEMLTAAEEARGGE